ncbi:putative bifunctional diguanylate cyclase/phosphodiesterase [Actinoplanes philippinensis]|uniref:putative bifunctional diguanylate cyclase/phosphodiesterase n=1 Tax=Actinoplanes philippinensis TaxID=35752 RepID=UPI001EF1A0A5|nr:bifunctional diguanylate cyclase/phosphodiesterase [Actinoplanes philippinensis]
MGLGLLAAMAVVSSQSAARAADTAAATQQASQQWNEIYLKISIEYELLEDYLDSPDQNDRQPLLSSIGSAEPNLRWLLANGGDQDTRQAMALQNAYGGYTWTLRNLIDAASAGDRPGTLKFAKQAALSASGLRRQASVNVARNNLSISVVLRDAKQDIARQLIAVKVLSIADLLLVILCGLVLLTYQKRTERQAADNDYRASHDGLTGLANRRLLTDRVAAAIAEADRGGPGVGLLLLDLNRFKEVNDTLGHHSGDLLLMEVARRLRNATRPADLVARLGGDEFAVLLADVEELSDAGAVAERLLTELCGPAELGGLTVDISGSIGYSYYPTPSSSAEELLQHADVAMYHAKRNHLGVAGYEVENDDNSFEQLTLLADLRCGIDRGELELHYQPKVSLPDRAVAGIEALVRWRHPIRGLLGPQAFVPEAEQSDLMLALTDAVLDMALGDQKRWRADGRDLPIAVNVGAACLRDSGFPGRVEDALRRHDAEAGLLTLEITESFLIVDPSAAAGALARLRDKGVRISIDDFGVGYSSMSYLQSMPLDELKIDRNFTAGILTTDRGRAIVGAIIDLAHAVDLTVVAEGIEDEATLAAVGEMGCEQAQGYLMCRPLPPAEIPTWLDTWTVPALS